MGRAAFCGPAEALHGEYNKHNDESEPENLGQRPPLEPGGDRRHNRKSDGSSHLPHMRRLGLGAPGDHREEESRGKAHHESLNLDYGMNDRSVVLEQPHGMQKPVEHPYPGEKRSEGEENPVGVFACCREHGDHMVKERHGDVLRGGIAAREAIQVIGEQATTCPSCAIEEDLEKPAVS